VGETTELGDLALSADCRCGPMRAKACSAQNTWLCKLAIHCRPAAVTFRYAMASSRCGETLVQ
jgi:hypothetical protein